MFCPKCGSDVEVGSSYCKNCGANIDHTPQSANQNGPYQGGMPPQYAIPLKSSGIAAVLSFIIPGAGIIYAGQIGKGLVYFIIGLVLALATAVLILLAILLIIFWVWQVYEAYNVAEEYNRVVQTTGQKPW